MRHFSSKRFLKDQRGSVVSLAAVAMVAVIGMTSVAVDWGHDFAARNKLEAETLFHRQQQVLMALATAIIAVEMDDPDLAGELYTMEEELGDACDALWQAAERRLQDGEIDGALKWGVLRSLDGCADKAAEAERLLWKTHPDTAQLYLSPRSGQTNLPG